MKKITLLATFLIAAISYGQLKQVKGNAFTISGCGAGGKGDVWYPNGHTATTGYGGPSGTANWEIKLSLDNIIFHL